MMMLNGSYAHDLRRNDPFAPRMEGLLRWLTPEADTAPFVHMEDAGESFVLTAEVPGITEGDLDIEVSGRQVVLSGERNTTVPEGFSAHRRERGAMRFTRSFELEVPIDSDRVEATLEHGVLQVTLPKAEDVKPRKISIKSA